MKLKLIRQDGEPYMMRWNLFDVFGLSAKIHLIMCSDYRVNHSHPFYYFNFILANSYKEFNSKGMHIRKPGFFSFRGPGYEHRLELFEYDKDDEDAQGSRFRPCLTLFITFRPWWKNLSWHYDCPKGKVDFKDFNRKEGCS